MPVVHVRALEPLDTGGLAAIARAVAAAIGQAPDSTWCTSARIEAMTVGDRATPDTGQIVWVDLWLRRRGQAADEAALRAACETAAAVAGVPVEDVWGALHPVEPGTVFAGGAVVSDG